MQVTYAKTSRAHEKEVKKSNDVSICIKCCFHFYGKTVTTQACNE